MAKLSEAAKSLLEEAECREFDDDYIIIGNIGVTVLLCNRAVDDLNRQARERTSATAEDKGGDQ